MKWLVFAGLKVVEGLVVVFLPYWIGLWNPFRMSDFPSNLFGVWLIGLLHLGICFIGCVASFLVIKANLELTKKILKKKAKYIRVLSV